MIYTFSYFGGIALMLAALMIYNLLKMFGLDVPIDEAQKSFI